MKCHCGQIPLEFGFTTIYVKDGFQFQQQHKRKEKKMKYFKTVKVLVKSEYRNGTGVQITHRTVERTVPNWKSAARVQSLVMEDNTTKENNIKWNQLRDRLNDGPID